VSESKQLTPEQFLAATSLPCEQVEVPQLGGYLYVQGLSGTERDAFEATLTRRRGGKRNLENVRARLLVRCLVDRPGGARLFGDSLVEVQRVGRIRVDVLQRLFDVAQRLSGLSDEDLDELGPPSETAPAG